CLHSPLVEQVDDTGRELLSLRGAFLSRRAYATFTRYALGQRRKLDADIRTTGAPRWKHAMHLLRLLTSARDLLRTGELRIDVGDQREPLLAVKRGEVPWARVEARMARLAAQTEQSLHRTPLPPEPDTARVSDFLFRVRRDSALQAYADHEVVQGVVRAGGVGQD
ncbi:DNA polymerase beta superfamily protein, partial [Streptomyces broussonetiae]|uniref:DNA polymerase beta superfamily protein n=1 Tax=Streptomyces broussonetiae TaxID=2686304 RepID=UPI0035E32FEA